MADKGENTLEVIGEQGGGRTDYRVESIGKVYDNGLNGSDEIGEKYVQGHVNGGTDTIGYDGVLKGIGFPEDGPIGDYTLKRNGAEVLPFHINMRTLEITGPSDTRIPYEVNVSGRIIGSSQSNQNDYISEDGETAFGQVKGGTDVWYYSGVLRGIDNNDVLDTKIDEKDLPLSENRPLGIVTYDG